MKTSFLTLFAFAGIFAGALAAPAPTRDPGAVVHVAVEKRDVKALENVLNGGLVSVQQNTVEINSTVAQYKAGIIEKDAAAAKIKDLWSNVVTCINSITANVRKEAAITSITTDALSGLVDTIGQLLCEIQGTLSLVASILDLNSLGGVVAQLAAAISTLLNVLVALVAGMLYALSGVLNGVLASLNGLLGNLLGGIFSGLGLEGLL